MTPREAIIDRELTIAYVSSGENKPKGWDDIISIWARKLQDIPIQHLQNCINTAILDNKKFKIATVGQVWAAWKDFRGRNADGFLPEQKVATTDEETDEQYHARLDETLRKYPKFKPIIDRYRTIRRGQTVPPDLFKELMNMINNPANFDSYAKQIN